MCNTTSNLGTWIAHLPNSQLAQYLLLIRHFSLPRPQPQFLFFYSLSFDTFASIGKCGWGYIPSACKYHPMPNPN